MNNPIDGSWKSGKSKYSSQTRFRVDPASRRFSALSESDISDAEQALIVNTVADIDWLLESKHIDRTQLAHCLNVSEARVSQIFKGGAGSNMTLKTLAQIFLALGEDVWISSSTLEALRRDASETAMVAELMAIARSRTSRAFQLQVNDNSDSSASTLEPQVA